MSYLDQNWTSMEVFGSTKIFENGVYYVVVVTIIFHEMEKDKGNRMYIIGEPGLKKNEIRACSYLYCTFVIQQRTTSI